MQRNILSFLNTWYLSSDRKPLILRGARQVGKTWAVRQLARDNNCSLIELNFEDNPSQAKLFDSNEPKEILKHLQLSLKKPIQTANSLLFLDEIQAAPELIAKLRWFSEKMPELPVICAGSLLEFALESHTFSMPVGRVSFAYLEPLSFEEFLDASGNQSAIEFIHFWKFGEIIPESIHVQLTNLFKEYLIIGGMPAAVQSWVTDQSLQTVSQIHHDLLASYRNDFSKYAGRLNIQRLEEVMTSVPRFLGRKFVYSAVNPDVQSNSIKHAVSLLNLARVCHQVQCTAANGVPIGAEIRSKFFKQIFLDVGLCCSILDLDLSHILKTGEITLINSGGIAEQATAQLLRTLRPFFIEPSLYYWERIEPGSDAEIDYIIQHGPTLVPIEVKSGATGSLKSLHLFMKLKGLKTAVRIYSGLPIQNHGNFRLISIPFYLLGQLKRFL